MSKVENVDIDILKKLVSESISKSELMLKLGYKAKGGNAWLAIDKKLKNLNIDISHFKGRSHGTSNTAKHELSDILIENSTYTNISRMKLRILKENLIEYKCKCCGLNSWQGKEITLELHHINGVNTDHRLENLMFLCPNCHSQTENFSGRNI